MIVRVLVVLALLVLAPIPPALAQSLGGTYIGTSGCLCPEEGANA